VLYIRLYCFIYLSSLKGIGKLFNVNRIVVARAVKRFKNKFDEGV